MNTNPIWHMYLSFYILLTLVYFWYRFLFLFLSDIKTNFLNTLYNGELITIIIPFFNEDVKMLNKSIKSVMKAKGKKQIILVDDGSDSKECHDMITKYFSKDVLLIHYQKNMGKRQAQKCALEKAIGEYIVTVDSDTVIKDDALIKLIRPMISDTKIGATTGNVKVYNEKENFLTKMISARYWSAFNIERKSLSALGIVTCCSGVLSAYRRKFFDKVIDVYANQEFLGTRCTYGDDRHLTNLVLKEGYKIKYVEDALCYTLVPSGYRRFIIQQIRWKKSFIRESLIALSFGFRHSFMFMFEIMLNLLIPFLSIIIRVSLILAMIYDPLFIPVVIASVITVAVIRNFMIFFENKRIALYTIPYAFFHEFVVFWLYPIALFRLKEHHWGTR